MTILEAGKTSPIASAIPRPRSPRLEYLDTVRGLAAVSVIVCHFVLQFGSPTRWLFVWPISIAVDASAAVGLFFVLSGIVLSLRFFQLPGEPVIAGYPSFAISRILRLWVPFAAATILSFAFSGFAANRWQTTPPPTAWAEHWWPAPFTFIDVLNGLNLFRFRDFDLIPQGWTLCYEMIFSLLIPAAILLGRRSSIALAVLAIFVYKIASVSAFSKVQGVSVVFCLHFTAGLMIAKHRADLLGWARKIPAVPWILLIPGALFYNWRFLNHAPWRDQLTYSTNRIWIISGFGAAIVLSAAMTSPRLQKILGHRALSHIGRFSYGIYLLHMFVLLILTPRFLKLLPANMPILNWWVGLAATIAASILLAAPFCWVIEKPSIRAGKIIAKFVWFQGSIVSRPRPD
jgi:peptidoglycan/LPS O-acetylase OafA/YrhL